MRRPRNPTGDPRRRLGRIGEDLVAKDLSESAYTIESRNERVAGVEIDIIARRKRSFFIIEVKTARAPRIAETMLSDAQRARLFHGARALLRDATRRVRSVQILVAAVRVSRDYGDTTSGVLVLGKNAELRYFRLADLDDETLA